ncbi:threonylcarbamoyladenosine tRNA methylthiotransferase [Candidatus Pacearchaeota archaeon ex4484_31]|nr:MAG: threonylcarbamoyladenosine tRNA methylthiotransferase [Candidatus Pacearchaeota archaeon ex4484_31]
MEKMEKTVYVEGYGCTANQNNLEIMCGLLERNGFIIVKNPNIARIALINTCIVKGPTEQRMIYRIKELARRFRHLIVSGCMVNVNPDKVKEIARKVNENVVVSLVGTNQILNIVKAVKNNIENKQKDFLERRKEIKLCVPKSYKNRVVGITQISEGCINRCSFCVVKIAKGNLFSYPLKRIVENIKRDLASKCKEIWITSQDNSSYGIDKGKQMLPELLKKITSIKGKFLVRVGMCNPATVKPIVNELVECYENEKIFKFLHLPVQSGSNKILSLMNRNYKVEDFKKIVRKFKKRFPEMTLATDIIVGFPSETEKDFKKTIELVKETKPVVVNISRFWSMPGTQASKMEQLDEKTKKKRAKELMKLHLKIAEEENKKFINKETEVLIDEKGFNNSWIGREKNYRQVVVFSKEKLLGKFCNVRIEEAKSHYLIGKKK